MKIEEVKVMYINAIAFTKCYCGEQLVMAQTIYNKNTYTGQCKCGQSFKLCDHKLFKVQNESNR